MGFWSQWSGGPKKHYLNQVGFFEQQEERPKRIAVAASTRLSAILENGSSESSGAHSRCEEHRAPGRKGGFGGMLAEVPEDGRPTSSGYGYPNSSGHSHLVWHENEKFNALRTHKQKRGGWKKLLIIAVLILLLILALGLGLGLGLRKKKADSSSSSTVTTSSTDNPDSPTSSTTTASPSPSQPADFPLGTYSLITFLDTVQTNCTANPSTWTCAPYTTYYTSPSDSLSTFTWTITAGATPSTYLISSSANPFSLSFRNAALDLLDAGKPTERYRFQIVLTKTVSPATNLTDDNAAVECAFAQTNLQANLYTRMAKQYPSAAEPDAETGYTAWPYAVRVEQSAAGGQGVPRCYRVEGDGGEGAAVEGLEAQDQSTLCSCLYKNWHTPS